MNTLSSLVAIAFYLLATAVNVRRLRNTETGTILPTALGVIAIASHAVAAASAIYTPFGIDLGIEQVLSLVNGLICTIILLGCIRRPLHSLLLVLYPLAAITLAIELLAPRPEEHLEHYSLGLLSHIIFSILAYSTMTISAIQAVILANQDRMLRQHQLRGLPSILPPLQTMEAMLFEMIWGTIILLTIAIATGVVYVDDMLAQHLAHKTVFSFLAWILLAVLLTGRMALGWRGRTAIRWTLWAFISLLLGYIGTKIALMLLMG